MSTQTPDVSPSDSAVEPQRESPGALLREARERARLTLDELSLQTKLGRNTLDALERDDFAALLEPVYVRGYYRKCAKVLDVSEQRLIEAYGRSVAPRVPQPPAKLRLASGTDLGSGSRLPVPLSLAAAVLAVVVCGVVWMTLEGGETAPQAPAVVLTMPTVNTGPVATETTALADAATDTQADAEEAPSVNADAPAVVPQPQPAVAAEATQALAAGSDGAVLRFENKSWVRIDDAHGKLLLSGEFSAGEARTVRGAMPLNVHLGNAKAVRLEYRGKPVDFSSQLRSNGTARFTLPLAPN